MLSVFPSLYNYGNLVPDLIRLFLGLYLLKAAWENYMMIKHGLKPKGAIFWSVLKVAGAGLFLTGLFIQPTALIFAILTLGLIMFRNKIPAAQRYPQEFYLLLIVAYVTLALLGPGLFAIDLPL